jgi:hypothetical protein
VNNGLGDDDADGDGDVPDVTAGGVLPQATIRTATTIAPACHLLNPYIIRQDYLRLCSDHE